MNARVRRVLFVLRVKFRFLVGSLQMLPALLLAASAVGQTTYTPYTFTTVAGLPSIGSVDGGGISAQFNRCAAVVVDSQGNIYVADTNNSTIRKVTPAGVVTTLAGLANNTGSTDGTGSAARFFDPAGIAMDGAGNLFVADTGNYAIRKLTPAGVVTTLAGSAGNSGYADGTGSAARFVLPIGVVLDSAGNAYVADSDGNTIRKITPAGVVTTLAGSGQVPSQGSADGTGASARFSLPHGVAVDGAGNLYVADDQTSIIRKITPAGVVTTLAGTAGIRGVADGTGSAAQFDFPSDLAVDSGGNVYVADTYNHAIRKITPAGVVTTLAGLQGISGSADGTGTAARFYTPGGVTVDGSGNVYVADTGNQTIRKVTSAGVVTTLAGALATAGITDATGTAASFNNPLGVAVDGSGNVYVADTSSSTIRKVTPAGVVTTLAGTAGLVGTTDGTGTSGLFNSPHNVTADSTGNLYVADTGSNTIRKVTPAGVVTTLAGTVGIRGAADGTGTAAQFSFPTGIAVDGAGNLYVADSNNNTIRKMTSAGVVTTVAGAPTNAGRADGSGSAAQFSSPAALSIDSSGNLYVADAGNNNIRKVTAGGTVTTVAGSGADRSNFYRNGQLILARFDGPMGVTVDSAGNIYVADTGNSDIRLITPAGIVSTLAGAAGIPGLSDGTGEGAQFNQPEGVAVDGAGNIYVADTINNAIRKVTPAGVVTTVAGTASSRGSADGTGSNARFNAPSSTAVDAAGNAYVADSSNSTIRKVTPAGVVTTVAGAAGIIGSADGTGTAARFTYAGGVAVDSGGNLYVADSTNETIRRIAPGGVVTTLAGTAGSSGSTDATGTAALFTSPNGVTVDSAGNIYVADSGNDEIRKITPDGVVTTMAGAAGSSGSVDAAASAARFASPSNLAVDGAGNVYVADTANQTIRMVTPAGVVTTLAGMAGTTGHLDATGTAAQFNSPDDVAIDAAGNVYVADTNNSIIRKIAPGGAVTTFAGVAGSIGNSDGTGSAARFSRPAGLSVDAQGNLYVADTGNNTIRIITPAGVVTTLAGSAFVGTKGSIDGPANSARFNEPNGVAVDGSGNLYVGDTFNATVRKITPDGTVNTLAGSPGAEGSSDGVGDAALFFLPLGVAVDHSGDVLVADAYNSTIRKIAPDGTVTTLAGMAGSRGSVDGTGSDAALYLPSSVAVDPSGNIFVADTANNLIRKVTSDGVVSTFAGLAGFSGSTDGVGSTARFSSPAGIAADTAGNLYVADTGNDTIRRLTPNQTVTTIAGTPGNSGSKDGTGMTAWFSSPAALAVDGSGNIFVVDSGNDTIRRITSAGVVTTVAGMPQVTGSADGTGSGALFNRPAGIAMDGAGTLYVTDSFNNTIRKGTPAAGSTGSGSSSTASSKGGSGSDTTGSSSGTSSGGSDSSGTGTSSGSSGTTSGSSGTGSSSGTSGTAAQFLFPTAVAQDGSGNLYVADASNNVIREITPAGVISTLAGTAGVAGLQDGSGTGALFNQPNGVAVDGVGNVYVADTGNGVIRKIASTGAVSTLAGSSANRGNVDGTGAAAAFSHPLGLAVDGSGILYVADAFTDTIRKVTAGGAVTTLAGAAATRGEADGTGTAALFNYPAAVAVDAAGNVYVADAYNDTIRKITPAGVVGTLAGSAGVSGANDGTGIYALFNQPMGVAVDGSGNVYVADTSNGTIRRVTPAGAVTTLAGAAGVAALMDGTGANALFNQPHGVMVDGSGTLYVADTGNAVIRKIAPGGAVTTLTLTAAVASGASSASTGSSTATMTSTAGGSSGGGGAVEAWFIGALALLGMARWMQRKSRASA
jgi:hypothetical protein